MATFYSSFFSSGLLAPQALTPRSTTPRPSSPTTPRAASSSLPDETTPTAPATLPDRDHPHVGDDSQVLPTISVAPSDDSRPRLRRRRSSLAGAGSPLTAMKTSAPVRQAAASAQRSLRSRSGSDASILSTASGIATFVDHSGSPTARSSPKPGGIVGRLRSGSLGTALRPRRGLRRSVPAIPAPPPPSAPLPALPNPGLTLSPTSPRPSLQSPMTPLTPQSQRRPLARRTQTFDNYDLMSAPFSVAGTSPMCIAEDEDAFAAALCHGSAPALLAASKGTENEMQVDYPSPVDGVVFDWGRHQPQAVN
ncbi:hypothetical protein C8Q80DRAFT_1272792 [Daedaleopsis nitida]|nr:hypothetical protein C8Q80DRAFT_1272792 [Daedaleopsis nitida]